ncbi:MAG TPA: hypothetical protein VHP33_26180 [Polyangiaceae bacterium]|nr:hypothetical protein [Polyangiaceae bacterium]
MNLASSRVVLRLAGPTVGLFVTIACGENASDPSGSGGTGTSSAGSVGTAGASGAASTAGATATGGAVTTAGSGTGGSANAGSANGGSAMAGSSNTTAGSGSGGANGGSASAGSSSGGSSAGASGSGGAATTEKFSFFVTSLAAVRRESGNMNGFGGKLGGLAGADEICRKIAEQSLPTSGAKGWRAFLSTSTVNAIDRVGTGPWYDRTGRLVANDVAGLLQTRPQGDAAIINDLPNETGVPNRAGTGGGDDDNHDTITGTNTQGKWDGGPTCDDWTSATGGDGPRVGHSWPAQSGMSWMQAHTAPGCEPSVNLMQTGAGSGNGIGNGGGYGGFYCFALKP